MARSEHAPARTRRDEALALAGLALSAFILNTSEFVPIGLLTDISAAFGIGEATAGVMISAYALAVALLALPLMLATSKVRPRRLILATLALFCVGQLCSAAAPTFAVLVLTRLVVACSHAVFWSVVTPYAVRVVAPERASFAMSFVVTGSSLAMVLGLPLGRALGQALGWRATFLFVAAVAVACVALLAVGFPRLEVGEPFTLRRLPELVRNRPLLGIYLATFVYVVGYYTGYSYVEPFLGQVVGLAPATVTATLTCFGIAGVVGSWLFGRLYDGHRMAFMGCMLAGVVVALLLLGPSAALGAGGAMAVCLLWGAASTAYNVSAQAEVIRVTDVASSAVAMSIFSGMFNAAIAAGSAVGSAVCAAGALRSLGVVGAALCLVALAYFSLRLSRLLGRHAGVPQQAAAGADA